MISEVETNKYRKFEVKVGSTIYYVLVEYDEDNDFSEFYITKENSAITIFQIGFNCPYEIMYDYIKDNIVDWIYCYEETLNEMEDNV